MTTSDKLAFNPVDLFIEQVWQVLSSYGEYFLGVDTRISFRLQVNLERKALP